VLNRPQVPRKRQCDSYVELRMLALICLGAIMVAFLIPMCDLPVDGAKGGLKRGNTPMMVKECYAGREDRSWQTEPA
jgi:hypothetical protein